MLAAIMGRTSKEVDDAYSVDSQIQAALAYAKEHNLRTSEDSIFREDFTGRVLDRPELNKIRQLVKAHKIHALIVYSVDRLARKVSVGEIILDELIEHGVELHIIRWGGPYKDTPEEKLRFNFEMTISGFERDIIVERTQRGKAEKAKQGFLMGDARPPYGFKYNGTKTNFEPSFYSEITREILLRYGARQERVYQIVDWVEAQNYDPPGLLWYNEMMMKYNALKTTGLLSEADYQKTTMKLRTIPANVRA